jgi:hypothetical protein
MRQGPRGQEITNLRDLRLSFVGIESRSVRRSGMVSFNSDMLFCLAGYSNRSRRIQILTRKPLPDIYFTLKDKFTTAMRHTREISHPYLLGALAE